MANQQAMSDEEVQLKRRARRRLIGAVTLVTVMVVTLPMVLDGEPKQSGQDIVINIPPQGASSEFASRIVPVPEQQKPAAAPAAPAAAAAVAQPPQQAEVQTAAQPAKTEEPAKPAAAEPQPNPKEAAPQEKAKEEKPAATRQESGPYVIQLGAFASMANAKERQSKLTALKIKFYTETVKTPGGDKLRVRAGPYASRQEAERVLAKLKAAGIQDGIVAEK